ncbi:MAG: hypothetical protein HKO81_00630 [Flavobacteriaceae bacterium]|nr:hypothetical protein [Flavobacteriaceae bacterium]
MDINDFGGIVLVGVAIVLFVSVYYSTRKTEEEKTKEKIQKQKRIEQEERRLAILRAEKEEIERKKSEVRKMRNDKMNEVSELIIKKTGEAYKATSKLVGDSSHKIKSNIKINISKHFLSSFSWVMVNQSEDQILFTFKSNNELIITKNGVVEKGSYELLKQNQSILITRNNITTHFNFVNLKNDYFFLNKVSTYMVYAFVNYAKYRDTQKEWFLDEIKKYKKRS